MKTLALGLGAIVLATSVTAETYSVSLGGKALGQVSYAEAGRKATLQSTLDHTPLGVFNGTFSGISAGSVGSSQFRGESRSSRKNRLVTVEISGGRAVKTAISPEDERTDMSDPARVPAGVMDPVRAMGQLFRAKGCPAPVRMYDGRRVVVMRSDAGTQSDDVLTCAVSYQVTAGPGHLSPLGISNARMQLIYDTAGAQQTLQQLKITSGIFSVSFARKN